MNEPMMKVHTFCSQDPVTGRAVLVFFDSEFVPLQNGVNWFPSMGYAKAALMDTVESLEGVEVPTGKVSL